MYTFECAFPPVRRFVEGTPRDRITAALKAVGETDMQTIAFRSGLDMETVYTQIGEMAKRRIVEIRGAGKMHSYVTVRRRQAA